MDLGQWSGWLGATYPWVKSAHIIFVIFWVAGLFLVPRFYVYHHATTPGSAEDRAWTEREHRARRIILVPAMLLVWLFGLMLAFDRGVFAESWFHAKLALVIALTGYQGWISAYGTKLAAGRRALENRTLRIMNEIPGIATALIVVLVVVRPF